MALNLHFSAIDCSVTIVHSEISPGVQWIHLFDPVSILPADPILSFSPDPDYLTSGTRTFCARSTIARSSDYKDPTLVSMQL